jgi:trans-aconitate 2-methyltransferase
MTWDPSQYLRYDNERSQPTRDLIAALSNFNPTEIVDLGCGTGNSTALLAHRWPDASLIGVDGSTEMLDQADQSGLHAVWQEADIATWQPASPVDLIFSNAALHWLDDHDVLFRQLVAGLRPDGMLAVQMPYNFSQPSHTLISEIATEPRWVERLSNVIRPSPVSTPETYLQMLEPLISGVRVWTTTYLHVLHGEHPVARWTGGATLRPVIAALEDDAVEFIADYQTRLERAYPRRADGTTVLPFTRMFILATR